MEDVHRLISAKLSTKDILNLVKAFPGSALQSTLKTAVLGEQKALYLMVDDEAYNGYFQYHYSLNNWTELLPPSVSPQLDNLPLATEEKYSLGYEDILQLESIEWPNDGGGQRADLSALFHSVRTLKVVLRKVGGFQKSSPQYLRKLCQLLEQFRPQLRSLTILLDCKSRFEAFPRRFTLWTGGYLAQLMDALKGGKRWWPLLEHFTLSFEGFLPDDGVVVDAAVAVGAVKPLPLLSTVRQCYLRVPPELLLNGNLRLLQQSKVLATLGLIVFRGSARRPVDHLTEPLLSTTAAFAAKFAHLHLAPVDPNQLSTGPMSGLRVLRFNEAFPRVLPKMAHFASLTAWDFAAITEQQYACMLTALAAGCPQLRHLEITVWPFYLVDWQELQEEREDHERQLEAVFGKASSFQQLRLPGVTSLKFTLEVPYYQRGK